MKVMAKPGCICPQENYKQEPITDKTPVEVPETAYYRRRLLDGSLVYAVHTEPPPSKKGAKNDI